VGGVQRGTRIRVVLMINSVEMNFSAQIHRETEQPRVLTLNCAARGRRNERREVKWRSY
jgi:hypothetical protein